MTSGRQIGLLLGFALMIGLIAGLAMSLLGIWLVSLGSEGDATVNLLGQTINSTNVGITAIFIGAVTLLFVVRRTLGSIDHYAALGSAETSDGAETESETSNKLEPRHIFEAVRELSNDQSRLFEAILSKPRGMLVVDVQDELGVSRAEAVYRARDLREKGLVEILTQTDQRFELSQPVRELEQDDLDTISEILSEAIGSVHD